MDKFEGNGAECMVRFIAGEKRGAINNLCEGVNVVSYNREEDCVVWNGDMKRHYSQWLCDHCEYIPPEPVYKDAPHWEAYTAYHRDKSEVEYRIKRGAPIEAIYKWEPVTDNYKAWADPWREYRIRIE